MTIEQLEFDFMKEPPVPALGFDHRYHRVCLTNGWNGIEIDVPAGVSSAEDVNEFIRNRAGKIRGYCDTWTMTDVTEHRCVVIDFGSHVCFGRADYV